MMHYPVFTSFEMLRENVSRVFQGLKTPRNKKGGTMNRPY